MIARPLSRPSFSVGIFAALLGVGLPSALVAQDEFDVRGQVVEMGTAGPLAGAEVVLPSLERWLVTDGEGRFRFSDLPAGTWRVEVNHLGYRKHEGELVVGAGMADPVQIELWPDPVLLEGLSAQVNRMERRRNAVATVVRVAERERLAMASSVEWAIRSMGETLVSCSAGEFCFMRRGRPVRPTVYIDENPSFGFVELNTYHPADLHTIEVIGHRMIRVYTVRFMERLARGQASLFPVLY